MPAPRMLLFDFFPRAGFLWRRWQGSPRILRSSSRDTVVQRALIVTSGGRVGLRRRDAQRLMVGAVNLVAEKINGESGIRPDEGIIEYLEQSANFSELSKAIGPEVWTELIFQMADARSKYKRRTPQALQDSDSNQVTTLALAVDGLLAAAGDRWDWLALEFYAYPHLMGEEMDYEIDEDSSEEEGDHDKKEEDPEGKDKPKDKGKGKDKDKKPPAREMEGDRPRRRRL
ncbi:hypothetical protein F5144DRAFT_551232 [Chaetomium tenue]|uniref:Uncharacterized protein n=1 Tax=Chaetomium tenue TaxID=1854479 RepID=A0ACB7P1L3_9PEZI|nr:hypothetical protein F5144DRAFT_551232 [Chaetomium globosum]